MSGPAPFEPGAAPGSALLPAELTTSPEAMLAPCNGAPSAVAQLGQAYVAIAALMSVVSRQLPVRMSGGRHLRECRVGQRVDGYLAAPCSTACVDAGGAYLLGMAALGRMEG